MGPTSARYEAWRDRQLAVLRVLHVLAKLKLVEQVYCDDGRIRWRRIRPPPLPVAGINHHDETRDNRSPPDTDPSGAG